MSSRDPEANTSDAAAARTAGSDAPVQARRFYSAVSTERTPGGFEIRLDGRTVKTPKQAVLIAPNLDLAASIAREWDAQTDRIVPSTMPVTKLVNSAIDVVTPNCEAVRADIVAYALNDALCYRADGPAELVARQLAVWDPIIAWAECALGARLTITTGIVHIDQPEATRAALEAATAAIEPLPLTAVHVVTTLTGSGLLALAVWARQITAEAAWIAAHVDEDHQIGLWGEDAEATERRQRRWRDMEAAGRLLESLR